MKTKKVLRRLFILALFALSASRMGIPAFAAEALTAISAEAKGYAECALGDFAADALREVTGADIALFAAEDLGQDLPMGEISDSRLQNSFPNNTEFSVVSMNGAALRALLEESFSTLVLTEDEMIDPETSVSGDFFCVSGLTLEYTAGALPGNRIYSLSVRDDANYTVALASRYVEGIPSWMLNEVLEAYLSERDTLEAPAAGRAKCLDAGENKIVGDWIDARIIYLAAGILLAFSLIRVRRGGGQPEKHTLSTDELRHD